MFDGKKSYIDIPENVLPEDIGNKFTISTWIKTGVSKGRQTILAGTDKERLDRVHFSLSISGTKLLFVHRPEANHASRDLYCKTDFQYKPAIFDSEWHHIVMIADGCNAKLYIDGKHHTPLFTESDWTLHKSKLKIRLTVGARYLAKENVYTENFSGYLSGLAIRPNNTVDEQVKDSFIVFHVSTGTVKWYVLLFNGNFAVWWHVCSVTILFASLFDATQICIIKFSSFIFLHKIK